jgi:hypothetical protein
MVSDLGETQESPKPTRTGLPNLNRCRGLTIDRKRALHVALTFAYDTLTPIMYRCRDLHTCTVLAMIAWFNCAPENRTGTIGIFTSDL